MKTVKEGGDMCEAVNELFADWTQREKERADAAEKRADAEKRRADKAEAKLKKANEEIARLKAATN